MKKSRHRALDELLAEMPDGLPRVECWDALKPVGKEILDEPVPQLVRIAVLAGVVFEDQQRAIAWLTTPQGGLGNRVPFELIQTEPGAQEVYDLLGRIEHGVFS